MAQSIEKIEGIGPAFATKLRTAGIKTVTDLLTAGADKKGRTKIAKETGLSDTNILEWVNHADLMRVSGIGEEFADLLEEAGVDTVKELAKRKPEKLALAIKEMSAAKNLTNRVPGEKTVAKWIEAAKTLPPVVKH
jgi:predicted flap endonuclease-1-like 5' DNA nuclease